MTAAGSALQNLRAAWSIRPLVKVDARRVSNNSLYVRFSVPYSQKELTYLLNIGCIHRRASAAYSLAPSRFGRLHIPCSAAHNTPRRPSSRFATAHLHRHPCTRRGFGTTYTCRSHIPARQDGRLRASRSAACRRAARSCRTLRALCHPRSVYGVRQRIWRGGAER